jgi:hypothetical protein
MYQQNVQTIYIVTRDTKLRDRRSSLLSDGDKKIEIEYDEETFFVLGRLEQPKRDKNHWYLPSLTNQPRKDLFHNVLLESPFTSVSNTQQGTPLSSLSDHNEQVPRGQAC